MGECPKCAERLEARAFGMVTVDGCAGCGGLWFDHQELNSLARDPSVGLMEVERAFQQPLAAVPAGGSMRCPRCRVELYEFTFPHTPEVRLDACPACKGIWLDDGELQQIAERIARGRQEPGRAAAEAERVREHARLAASFLLSAPCPSCRTTNPAASPVCWACGAPIRTRAAARFCPRCDRPLEELPLAGGSTAVDACLSCGGVWFHQGELGALMQLGPEPVQAFQARLTAGRATRGSLELVESRVARCPGCHYGMERKGFGGSEELTVDTCTHCGGAWLDGGELVAVCQVLLRRGGGMPAARDPWAP